MKHIRVLRNGAALGSLLFLGSALAQAFAGAGESMSWPAMTIGGVTAAIWHQLHIECSDNTEAGGWE